MDYFRLECKLVVCLLLIMLGLSSISATAVTENIATVSEQNQTTTWIALESDYPDATYRDVEFINITHGWVVGILNSSTTRGGVILHTEDSGDSWDTQLLDDEQLFLQLKVVNSQTVWVTGLGRLFYTTDGGVSWDTSIVYGGYSGMSTVEFVNYTHGWTATMQTMYKTADSGQTWQTVPGWVIDDTPWDIHFLNESHVWAIGYSGIYRSIDGAETWEKVFDEGGWSMSFPDAENGWAISDHSLLSMTENNTWEKRVVPGRLPQLRLTPPYCSDIQFIDSQNGWIVGKEIPVMHTSDGGVTWYEQTGVSGHSSRLMALCFIDEIHGWAVGYDGGILRTSNGNNLDVLLQSDGAGSLVLIFGIIGLVTVIPLGIVVFIRKRRRSTRSLIDIE